MYINKELKPIPEIGKYYHFFDDGKISPGRYYICKCERIITVKEAKNIMIEVPNEYIDDIMDIISLYEHWYDNVMPNHDWLYSEDTDYFVECSCPEYDENNLWFIRTKDGGWFSMDIQNFWQAGSLDVTGKRYQHCIDNWGDDNWEEHYPPADEKHYWCSYFSFKAGANYYKQQMLKNAVSRVVHIDNNSCPFLRRYELAYDIKTQVPDISEGDKVKIIIIKES